MPRPPVRYRFLYALMAVEFAAIVEGIVLYNTR